MLDSYGEGIVSPAHPPSGRVASCVIPKTAYSVHAVYSQLLKDKDDNTHDLQPVMTLHTNRTEVSKKGGDVCVKSDDRSMRSC